MKNVFPLRPTPKHASDDTINSLFDYATQLMRTEAKHLLEQAPVPEQFLTAPRRHMVYDRIPVGHDTGYRCYDGTKHDSESAFTSGEFGDGLSENEAYVDWLRNVDEPERPATAAERELDEAIDAGLSE